MKFSCTANRKPAVLYTHYLFSTKETVQYTDSKEIKTMFHSILCRFLSAFLKIYWQISMCYFFSLQTWQLKTTHLPNETNFVWKKNTFWDDPLGLLCLSLLLTIFHLYRDYLTYWGQKTKQKHWTLSKPTLLGASFCVWNRQVFGL